MPHKPTGFIFRLFMHGLAITDIKGTSIYGRGAWESLERISLSYAHSKLNFMITGNHK